MRTSVSLVVEATTAFLIETEDTRVLLPRPRYAQEEGLARAVTPTLGRLPTTQAFNFEP